jgi:arsenate reductase (glutaredoxin)
VTQTLKVYHYPACDSCRKAVKALQQQGYTVDLHNIKETPPSAEELRKLIPLSGLPIAKWFNVSGEVYREMGLKDKLKEMSDDDKIKLLASNGMLIKRPIVTDGKRASIGFREEEFTRIWYNS